MQKVINRESLIKATIRRPAVCRNLVNPTEEILLTILEKNVVAYKFFKDEWKTRAINDAFFKEITSWKVREIVECLPEDYRRSISNEQLEYTTKSGLDQYFFYTTEDHWEIRARISYSLQFNDIPGQFRTPRVIRSFLIHPKRSQESREKAWPYLTPEIIPQIALEGGWRYLPKKVLTSELLLLIVKEKGAPSISTYPEHLFTQEIVDILINLDICYVSDIPERFRTRELMVKYLEAGHSLTSLPACLAKDKELLALGSGSYLRGWSGQQYLEYVRKLAQKDKDFVYDCFTKGFKVTEVHKNLQVELSPDLALKIVTVRPGVIKVIPKPDQTTAIVESFLKNADADTIKGHWEHLNLIRITKELVPMLLGIDEARIQAFVARKMTVSERQKYSKEIPVVTENDVLVDMTPAEMRDYGFIE